MARPNPSAHHSGHLRQSRFDSCVKQDPKRSRCAAKLLPLSIAGHDPKITDGLLCTVLEHVVLYNQCNADRCCTRRSRLIELPSTQVPLTEPSFHVGQYPRSVQGKSNSNGTGNLLYRIQSTATSRLSTKTANCRQEQQH